MADNDLAATIAGLPPNVRYALYGAGQYTRRMMAQLPREFFFADGRFMAGIIDDAPGPLIAPWSPRAALPDALANWDLDWIVLSTDWQQQPMLAQIAAQRRLGRVPAKLAVARPPEASLTTWQTEHEQRHYRQTTEELFQFGDRYLGGLRGRRVLDFGCGKYFPYSLLLADRGVDVIGVDVDRLNTDRDPPDAIHAWLIRYLEQEIGHRLPLETVKLAGYDGRTLPFYDDTFDMMFSHSVFEHLADVTHVVREMHRVLKPGGYARHMVHLWPSLTGFHPFRKPFYYQRPLVLPPDERPWAHLYDEHAEAMSDLNRWREADFRRAFEAVFEVVDRQPPPPLGAEYLTPELERKLAGLGFDRNELLTEGVFYILRKRPR